MGGGETRQCAGGLGRRAVCGGGLGLGIAAGGGHVPTMTSFLLISPDIVDVVVVE